MSEDRLHALVGNQLPAVAPGETVWLSASAGTGKTQVLAARVLRLLLEPRVTPDQILCLTFTKAGATEMAARINATLARWVRANAGRLGKELQAIGADLSPTTQARARTLFAAVLDCPGGGLRINTIHAFSQWLLAAFPAEAGLDHGARPMEDRERVLLARATLAQVLVDAETHGDAALLDALAMLSLRMGADDVERFLLRCADARELWTGPGGWAPPLAGHVRRVLGLPDAPRDAQLAALCDDAAFDIAALRHCLQLHRAWPAKTGQAAADAIDAWLALDGSGRVAGIDALAEVFLTRSGEPRAIPKALAADPDYSSMASRAIADISAVLERRALLDLAEWLAPALTLGRAFALAWGAAKAREGVIDFDDQIRRAADLLHRAGMADWIRYKLDRRFDHILVDEAQDTNEAQWRIIDALVGDFFAGEGAHGDRARTLFVVGDYKQAIFGFQGTSPENFGAARQRVESAMAGAADNARVLRAVEARELLRLGLGRSFRTAAPVLDFVDRAIAHIGPAAFGLTDGADDHRHEGEPRPGQVVFWRPISVESDDSADDDAAEDAPADSADPGAENWLSRPDRALAHRIARQVRHWMITGFPLVKGRAPGDPPRRAGPGDVMVLVRKRRDLAGLIVAQLHAEGVAVAGVDRLRLGAPLGVQDLIAALRFAAQPFDDLSLAALLVSPLVGWSQAQLLEHGYRPRGVPLWRHLRALRHPDVDAAMALLGPLLARADFEPVQAVLHWLLVGPWQARKRLVARLGQEANDPIDELLNAALAYAATATPSLAGFLAWFDAGDGELKREQGRAADLVRVMTVHGAKGLQAPIVILADATGDPEAGRGTTLSLTDPASLVGPGGGERRAMPLPGLRKEERLGPIAQAEAAVRLADAAEHWRLLYVAMTRAEEALFITGALGSRHKVPPPGSWYARLAELTQADAWVEDAIWGARFDHGAPPGESAPPPQADELPIGAALPGWLTREPMVEARPARPLVPSALGEDLSSEPPSTGAGRDAARRGTLIHGLLERLPALVPAARTDAATRWLARQAGDLAAAARAEIADAALRVIADPRWAELFSPAALAEAPIAALVGTRVIAGTIDRLLVRRDTIHLVDFKSTRRPPATLAEVATATLRQMAAYVAALEVTYPGRPVAAALLYTQVPMLIELPDAALEPYKRALLPAQRSLPA